MNGNGESHGADHRITASKAARVRGAKLPLLI
jgi:hypothetical protein